MKVMHGQTQTTPYIVFFIILDLIPIPMDLHITTWADMTNYLFNYNPGGARSRLGGGYFKRLSWIIWTVKYLYTAERKYNRYYVCRGKVSFNEVYICIRWDLNDNFVGLWSPLLSKSRILAESFCFQKSDSQKGIHFVLLWEV